MVFSNNSIGKKVRHDQEIPEVPAIALGACELTLYEMVGAVNAFNIKECMLSLYLLRRYATTKGVC